MTFVGLCLPGLVQDSGLAGHHETPKRGTYGEAARWGTGCAMRRAPGPSLSNATNRN